LVVGNSELEDVTPLNALTGLTYLRSAQVSLVMG
jgi:hypothetical protein